MQDIKFKYFKQDTEKHIDEKAICLVCRKKGIEIGASTKNKDRNKIEPICIDCAIKDYARNHKIKDIEEAKRKRRRMFDINYLLFEILIDAFMASANKSGFQDLTDEDMEFNHILTQEIYNNISKKEKERLEGLAQDEIEKIFHEKIEKIFASQVSEMSDNKIIFSAKSDISGKIMTEYIDYHKYLKNDTPTEQEIEEAIKTIANPIITNEAKKLSILILAHAGTKDALISLKSFATHTEPEMKIWAEQAIGECQLFMENN